MHGVHGCHSQNVHDVVGVATEVDASRNVLLREVRGADESPDARDGVLEHQVEDVVGVAPTEKTSCSARHQEESAAPWKDEGDKTAPAVPRMHCLGTETGVERHLIRGSSSVHCNFLRYHFQPFSLNLVLPSVVKPSGAIAKRGTRHLT